MSSTNEMGAPLEGAQRKTEPRKRGQKAREGFEERFVRIVDPEGTLDPEERAARVAAERKRYFKDMAERSRTARRERAQASKSSSAASQAEIKILRFALAHSYTLFQKIESLSTGEVERLANMAVSALSPYAEHHTEQES